MGSHKIRLHRIEVEIFNKNTVECLRKIGIVTVGDLLHCEFKKLITHKEILSGWDEIVKLLTTIQRQDTVVGRK